MLESKISNVPENDSFEVSFVHFKLRRELQEDYMEVRKSKIGVGLQYSKDDVLS